MVRDGARAPDWKTAKARLHREIRRSDTVSEYNRI
jgi:hypothetical protein